MPVLDESALRRWAPDDVRHVYTARDTILYALGVGAGSDPLDARALRLVYERDLQALPTMAAVLGSPGAWMREPAFGIDFVRLVHGEQSLRMHAPLPAAGTVLGRNRIRRIVDKGEGKGAILHVERQLLDERGERTLATLEQVLFLRGNGGFSGGRGVDAPAPAAPALPDRAPDRVVDAPTRADQAVIYRLSGDLNPLHIEPAFAAKAGFPRPILHGLATWGIAGRLLVEHDGDGDPARLTAMRARFTSPVYPGETLRLETWAVEDRIAFRVRAVQRDLVVLDGGWAELRPA